MNTPLESKKIENKGKLFLIIILYANFIRFVQVSVIDIGLPDYIIILAGTLTSYGLAVGIYALMQALFQFPIAIASDKFGRKLLIILSIIIYTIGTFLCYIAENILQLIIFRAIQGIGAYSSIIQAMVGDYYRKQHGKGMALYSFTITLGYFAGFIIGGFISFYYGSRSTFLMAGFLSIISIFIIFILLKQPQNPPSEVGSMVLKQKVKFSDIRIILKEKQYQLIILINSFRWALFFGIYYYIIWVIQVYYKISQIQSAYLLIFVILLYAICIMIGGFLVDHIGCKKTMIIGQILIVFFGFVFFLATGFIVFLLVNIFVSIGFALLETAGNAYVSKLLEDSYPNMKGSGFGFNNTLGFFSSGIGPIIIAFLGEIDTFLPYYLISIIILSMLLITIKFLKL